MEISFDPLSDTTPTWTDLSSRLLEVRDVTVGVDNDMDDPKPGTGTFLLDNRDRALEPGYAASPYYPNVRPLRRIRWQINDGSTTHPIFFGFIVDWGPSWPDSTINQVAEIRAVDGHMILELDKLDLLDPPSASSLEEVIMHDEPFAYYKNGEKAGTKAEPVTGPEGIYKNTPTLGQQALVTGEAGTSVLFASASSERMEATVDSGKFADTNQFTLEAVVRGAETMSAVNGWAIGFAGGAGLGKGDGGFWTGTATAGTIEGTTGYNEDETRHLFLTWTGQLLSLYVDGVLEATSDSAPVTQVGGTTIYVGRGAAAEFFGGYVQHAVFYEHALTAERVAAHYAAGTSGFAQQTAGARITSIVTSDLWAETGIDAGTHTLQPVMEHGQSKLEEILNATRAELNPPFYFDGDGNPVYKGWDWTDGAASQATFGTNTGEVPFVTLDVVADDHIYNIATVAREGGLAQTATDADSISEFRDRNFAITGLLHTDDSECLVLATAIISRHATDELRIKSITLTGEDSTALAQILTRDPGDLIRVKHRPKGGTAQDRVSYILGRSLSVGENRQLVCTWNLSRGFDAAASEWRLGISGFSELNTTAVLA